MGHRLPSLHLNLAFFTLFAFAQLHLPSPPFLPPNTSFGALSSPSTIPNAQWTTLLGNLLYFYEAQRSGKLPSDNRVPWRNDSALRDGQDAGVDLSGGYFDAGDYLKCTFPLSFTLMSVCWGAMDFGAGYDIANQTAYLDSMLRWGLDWLINAHPQPRTLFVQVDDAQTDNNYWGGDTSIPGRRPSFQINDTSPGTDAAAQAAAAFAACSILYSNESVHTSTSPAASLFNASYSQILRTHAEQLYDFALNASGGKRHYQESVPEVANTYPSSTYEDDLIIAALFLSLPNTTSTTSNIASGTFYNHALESSSASLRTQDAVFNWNSKTPALPVLFTQIATVRPEHGGSNITSWKAEAEKYFDRIVDDGGRGKLTKGGLLWYDGDSDEASLNPALNTAMLMFHYAPFASSSDKRVAYQNFAQGQLDYALGKNPMSVPYIVGSNPNSPANAHSASASGGNDINAINTDPRTEAYIIYGGVVGGPDKHDQYYDIRNDWVQTEVALDYGAPMLSLAAYSVLSNPNDPFFVSLQAGEYEKRKPRGQPCDAALPCKSHGLPLAAIIVISVLAGILGLALVAWLLRWLWRRFKLKK